jgi:phosphate uptake regulator
MKRKIVKHGSNTLTISLPAKWCKKIGVSPGEELDVDEKGNMLIVGGAKTKDEQEITIDITGRGRRTILSYIQGLYRYGYDKIEILSKDTKVYHLRLEKDINLSGLIYETARRMVGAEVVSATPGKSYTIKRIAEESFNDFQTILRRIFLLLNEMMAALILGLKKNDPEILESIEDHHANIKKFENYCLRLLNKYGYEDPRKTCFYFHIISLLSKVEDIIKNNSRYVLKYKIRIKNPRAFELLYEIEKSINGYYDLFYKFSLDKNSDLSKIRHNVRKKLFVYSKDLTKEENVIMGGLSPIVEIVLDMCESRMGLEK